MFRNRKSTQKPGDEFITDFRKHFPEIVSTTPAGKEIDKGVAPTFGDGSGRQVTPIFHRPPTQLALLLSGCFLIEAENCYLHHSVGAEDTGKEINDPDPTPRARDDAAAWRWTPSILGSSSSNFDSNSFGFPSFNPAPGPYTLTPGGTNTLYHHQAGDLHMGMGMDGLHTETMMGMPSFPTHDFHDYNPFAHSHHHHQPQPQPTSYAPSSFIHQDTGYETMDHDGSPMDDDEGPLGSMERVMHQSPLTFQPHSYDMAMPGSASPFAEKFRFQAVLNAPTAMVKNSQEIPVTYLNKGQAYSVSILDTEAGHPLQPGTRYRTFVRISFEDEQQRQRPASCWQLWKEGRGTNEAHQRGGKLQAVEYVESTQIGESDEKRTRMELDTASFDGFSVIWTPAANCVPECNIAVRFNFLSTDFSHSKGVKGIPVRFCAKTETLSSGSPHTKEASEVAFCKVKLFRDHGAERKLSNDIAHIKKTIDKLKQQINQAETGMKDFGKRKRGSTAKAQISERPGKVQKHKRTWSMSSASSAGGRAPVEEDLQERLLQYQDMFQSTRPTSVLFLRGSEQDDPDLFPVALAGEPLDLTKVNSRDNATWAARSSARSSTTGTSSIISPSPSSISLHSQAAPSAANLSTWNDFHNPDDTGSLSGWIEALGVDPSYNPPVEQPIKPVACFYVLRREPAQPAKREYHRAIYLMQRSLKDFTSAIASKWNFEPTKITRTIHVLENGLQVEMDDDVIRELSEGQDFILEVQNSQAPVKREWEMELTVDNDSAGATQNVVHSEGYELKLFF
ncbi:CP2 transcription factor [Botrytis cinerea]